MRTYFVNINRRFFLHSIAGFAVNIVVTPLPFSIDLQSQIITADQEFVVVNGWVLTREDLAGSNVTFDVI